LVGAPGTGKSTMATTVVSRSAGLTRGMPYTRTRLDQTFLTSIRSPHGDVVMMQLVDGRSCDDAETWVAPSGGDRERWCYMVVFDWTRIETFVWAKRIMDRIREADRAAQADRTKPPKPLSPMFLVGNKRELRSAHALVSELQETKHVALHWNVFVFSGSALDNAFVCVQRPREPHPTLITLGWQSAVEGHDRLSLDHVLYWFKVKMDDDAAAAAGGRKGGSRRKMDDPEMDEGASLLDKGEEDTEEASKSWKNKCCRRKCC
jgi:hypothetical protein